MATFDWVVAAIAVINAAVIFKKLRRELEVLSGSDWYLVRNRYSTFWKKVIENHTQYRNVRLIAVEKRNGWYSTA
jgi:hypothetical protein